MKNSKEKKGSDKFNLEKFKVAKLKNLHLVNGGGGGDPNMDDPLDTNDHKAAAGGSSRGCNR